MYTVTEIEDAVLNTLKEDPALSYVRNFSPVPSLAAESLKAIFPAYPAVGIMSPRGTYGYATNGVVTDTSLFTVLCLNRNLRSVVASVHGALGEKGLWDLVEDCRRVLLTGVTGINVIDCLPLRRVLLKADAESAVGSLEVQIKWRGAI